MSFPLSLSLSPLGNLKEVPMLRGSRVVKLTAQIHSYSDDTATPTQFLTSSATDEDCPLDIIINLMVSGNV